MSSFDFCWEPKIEHVCIGSVEVHVTVDADGEVTLRANDCCGPQMDESHPLFAALISTIKAEPIYFAAWSAAEDDYAEGARMRVYLDRNI